MLYVWFGLFVLAAVLLVSMAVRFNRLSAERDRLEHRIFAARSDLFPLLDDALYRSVKDWRRKHPGEGMLTLGLGHPVELEADHLVRAFCFLKPTADENLRLAALLGKIGGKFEVSITNSFDW